MPSPSSRAVVFDMDGLLLDTEPIYRNAWQSAAREFGREIDDALYGRLLGRTNLDAERVVAESFGADFPFREFRERWLAHWVALSGREAIARKPGLDELLAWLDAKGVGAAVATSTERGEALRTLRLAGLAERFPVVVTGDEVERGKPAPDIFIAAAHRLGVPAECCVALEDSDAGALAAAAAGMQVIVVPDLVQPSAEAAGRATGVVRSLHDVPALLERLWA